MKRKAFWVTAGALSVAVTAYGAISCWFDRVFKKAFNQPWE